MDLRAWDDRYRSEEDLDGVPATLLVETAERLPPGEALDLACRLRLECDYDMLLRVRPHSGSRHPRGVRAPLPPRLPSYRCRVGQAGRLPGTKDLQNKPPVRRFLRRFRSRRERKIFNAASQLAVRCYAFSGLRPKKWPFGAAGMKFPCKCGEVSLPYATGGDARYGGRFHQPVRRIP